MAYTIPPPTRAVGTVDPPGDMNNVSGVLSGNSRLLYNVLNSAYAGGADPSGAADSTAAFQAAITAAAAAGAPVYAPAGTYKIAGNLTATAMPFVLKGDGRRSTILNCTGSGDALRVFRAGSYVGAPSGSITGITFDGTSASAGACGLHLGDVFQFGLDVEAREFKGTGSIGVHLDNNRFWTEQLHGQIFAQFNSTGVMFDQSADNTGQTTGSFDRLDLDVYIDQGGFGDGVTFTNGAFVVDGRGLRMWGNFATSTTQYAALRITGSDAGGPSMLTTCGLEIGLELDDAVHLAPYTIFFGSTANFIFGCTGRIAFSDQPWTASNAHSNQLRFQGIVTGDFNLSSSIQTQPYSSVTAMSNGATVGHGNAGAVYLTNSGSSFTGLILAAGGFVGERLALINEGAGTLTFDVAGTSNVANGVSCVIAGNTSAEFLWANTLWYRLG